MNRAIYTFSIALVTAPLLTLAAVSAALAQSVPQINRLTPLQQQQFARDLVPSGAQDFFNAGNARLEQEIRRLAQQRSSLNENLLKVNQERQPQSNDHFKQPDSLPRDRAQ
ncbi:MAG: hypothetical protein KME45_33270 [Stenomitos rutilans HA7619-LM2]|jgi:hypothetical protein|nr:hypothetical protein [Stenomitos rutilans HA7619-LM2]